MIRCGLVIKIIKLLERLDFGTHQKGFTPENLSLKCEGLGLGLGLGLGFEDTLERKEENFSCVRHNG
jgi:hypothetical protein